MGVLGAVADVKLFAAIMFTDEDICQRAREILEAEFGCIESETDRFDFTFTAYYREEMGDRLAKQFISFEPLIHPDRLIDIKLRTNEIEEQFTVNGHRQVNIDPGYLTNANIVLATTKNFSHRMHLGKGIYGDVHLRFMHGKFSALEWTYPDYQQAMALKFFENLKLIYGKSLKNLKHEEGH